MRKTYLSIVYVYSASLNFAVLFSSLFFIFWFLATFLFREEKLLLIFLVALLLLSSRVENKLLNKIIILFRKTSIIVGSILLLFLFINSYLIISDVINKQFLDSWGKIENLLNQAVFMWMFVLILFFLYIGFIYLSVSFILEVIKRIKPEWAKIFFKFIVVTLILSLLAFPYFVLEDEFVVFLGGIFYSKFNWLFGFSLISLHLNYLIKEARKIIFPLE